jgi:hypothetical protein
MNLENRSFTSFEGRRASGTNKQNLAVATMNEERWHNEFLETCATCGLTNVDCVLKVLTLDNLRKVGCICLNVVASQG